MPDAQEVFRMATQKVRPDPGALERQNRSQQRRSTRQRAGGYALLAILVIAAVMIGIVVLRPRDERPAGQPDRDAPSAADLLTKPYFLDLGTGEATLLPKNLRGGYSYAASPDGTRLAYAPAKGGGCEGPGVVTVANIDGTDVRTIESPEGLTLCAPRWSPDGTKLVYQARNGSEEGDVGNLFVHDLSTGETTQVTHLELTRASWWYLSPSFAQLGDDSVIFFHMPRSSAETTRWDVWSVPATGGEPTLLLSNASWPMSKRFGIQFLQPSASDLMGQSIMTVSLETRQRGTLAGASLGIWWPTLSPNGKKIAYQDGGSIYVLQIMTGETSIVAKGGTAEWLDDDTLIVAP